MAQIEKQRRRQGHKDQDFGCVNDSNMKALSLAVLDRSVLDQQSISTPSCVDKEMAIGGEDGLGRELGMLLHLTQRSLGDECELSLYVIPLISAMMA